MILINKSVVVTGGSRGLGLGLVEVLVERGAKVTVVARDEADLASVSKRFGVTAAAADITDADAATRILAEISPDILVLNAGAPPRMGRLDRISWSDFTTNWETDVKGGLHWIQAALNHPLKPGSRVLVGSSGAARQGSPLSGGYAGAKRMLWFMAKYADAMARERKLGIRFQAVLPMQIVGGTGTGDVASAAYAQAAGLDRDAFLARFGEPLSPRRFGDAIATILEESKYEDVVAFGLKGDTGITVLGEGDAA
jgi:NAD(P)-dependent dehydrogenase (short-subunit alcohol dehydrogenase family)